LHAPPASRRIPLHKSHSKRPSRDGDHPLRDRRRHRLTLDPRPLVTGTLTPVGALGVDTTASAGLEVIGSGDGATGTALAVLTLDDVEQLFEFDLPTGDARDLGEIGFGIGYSDLNSLALVPSDLNDLFADGDFGY
jgi:hypothetical protein